MAQARVKGRGKGAAKDKGNGEGNAGGKAKGQGQGPGRWSPAGAAPPCDDSAHSVLHHLVIPSKKRNRVTGIDGSRACPNQDLPMLDAYRAHVDERAADGIVPKPLDADQTAALVELLKAPPTGEDDFILDLFVNRVPPGVDEAAYVKASFLSAVAAGDAESPLIDASGAVELLGTP